MADNTKLRLSDLKLPENMGKAKDLALLVTEMSDCTAANGNPYAKITFMDGHTKESVNKFKTSVAALNSEGISVGTIVEAKIRFENSYFNIDSIAPTKNTALKPDDFIKHPPVDVEKMFGEICSLITESADTFGGKYIPLAKLALKLLNDNKQNYITSSAAVSMHHDFKGGLIYHSYRMVKAADALCGVYTSLDRELMICGAALHDIGKIWEYKTSDFGEAEFTKGGVLNGHLYMGASAVSAASKEPLEDTPEDAVYNPEKVKLLVHMILSHHGNQEWGAVVPPATAEAYALHYIDCLDAKMYVCEENAEAIEPGMLTEKRPFGCDNRIYKPNF